MEPYNKWLENKKTFFLLTGGSRGFGKTLSLRFAPHFAPDSVIVLIARNQDKLEECKREITLSAPKVKVYVYAYDLNQPDNDKFRHIILSSLTSSQSKPEDFEQVILVHNAATVGVSKLALDACDPSEWSSYMLLNLVTPACLSSVFFNIFTKEIKQRLILNITAMAGVIPLLSLPFYNTGRAARNQFFRTLAEEDPSIRVLTYSPGPIYTDMMDEVMQNMVHPVGRKRIEDMHTNKMVISTDEATNRLFEMLKAGNYQSGILTDYHKRA